MNKLLFVVALGIVGTASSAYALPRIIPERCAHDSLNQWSDGQALEGTARGRNAWLKSCSPIQYETIFPGDFEFEPNTTRRTYVTYGIILGPDANGNIQFDAGTYRAPTTPESNPDAVSCKSIPNPYKIVGVCTSGCITPDQNIDTNVGSQPILEMWNKKTDKVAVASQTATGGIGTEFMSVQSYIRDMIPAKQKIIELKMSSGEILKLTPNHPMLTPNLKMTNAEDLKVNDQLVSASGKSVSIIGFKEVDYFGRVYNLVVDTDDMKKSTYIVNGFISGDKKFQDLNTSEVNRRILRNLARK